MKAVGCTYCRRVNGQLRIPPVHPRAAVTLSQAMVVYKYDFFTHMVSTWHWSEFWKRAHTCFGSARNNWGKKVMAEC